MENMKAFVQDNAVILVTVLAAALLLLGAASWYVFLQPENTGAAQAQVAREAQQWYELSANTETELLTVRERDALYQVILRDTNTGQSVDVYVTKDGSFLIQNAQQLGNATQQLQRAANLYTCLQQKNAAFHGQFVEVDNATDNQFAATLNQITMNQVSQLPAGQSYLNDLAEQCTQAEMEGFKCPYFAHGNETLRIVQEDRRIQYVNASQLAAWASCTY